MPGKKRPAASRITIQRPPTTRASPKESLQKHETLCGVPVGETAEGLDYRFLRSQPRVIGLGLLHWARPRQSDYNTNTQPKGLIINAQLPALQIHMHAR